MLDIFLFLLQNLNPTQLDRKFNSETDKSYVKMLWEKCIPSELCKFVYLKENFTQLSQSKITFQMANNIIKVFVEQNKTNIELLRQYLKEYAITYQIIFATIYPKIYSSSNNIGIHNKSIFHYNYREWYITKYKKKDDVETTKTITTGKNSKAYIETTEVNKIKQKPAEIKFKI